MDTERGAAEQQLLAHAERQTKALETISFILRTASALALIAVFIYLVSLNA